MCRGPYKTIECAGPLQLKTYVLGPLQDQCAGQGPMNLIIKLENSLMNPILIKGSRESSSTYFWAEDRVALLFLVFYFNHGFVSSIYVKIVHRMIIFRKTVT